MQREPVHMHTLLQPVWRRVPPASCCVRLARIEQVVVRGPIYAAPNCIHQRCQRSSPLPPSTKRRSVLEPLYSPARLLSAVRASSRTLTRRTVVTSLLLTGPRLLYLSLLSVLIHPRNVPLTFVKCVVSLDRPKRKNQHSSLSLSFFFFF